MTLADKKIEDFRWKFCSKVLKHTVEGKKTGILYQLKGGLSDDLENWLRKTLSEAEREGMKKAYNDCSNNGGELSIDFHKFTEQKLKELERE